jgi:hypothetical protein
MATDNFTSFIDSFGTFPQGCGDFIPNYDFCPVLFLKRDGTQNMAVLKMHMNKNPTKDSIYQKNFCTSYWKIDGFMLQSGGAASMEDRKSPNGLSWNVSMLSEKMSIFDIVHNPPFLFSTWAPFPIGTQQVVPVSGTSVIDSVTLDFGGGTLDIVPTNLKITTKMPLKPRIDRVKIEKLGKVVNTLYFLNVSFLIQ